MLVTSYLAELRDPMRILLTEEEAGALECDAAISYSIDGIDGSDVQRPRLSGRPSPDSRGSAHIY